MIHSDTTLAVVSALARSALLCAGPLAASVAARELPPQTSVKPLQRPAWLLCPFFMNVLLILMLLFAALTDITFAFLLLTLYCCLRKL